MQVRCSHKHTARNSTIDRRPCFERGFIMNSPAATPSASDRYQRLNAWLEVCPNGTILLKTAKVELGQGILIALRQIVAEELNLPLGRVEVLSGATKESP